MTLFNKAKNVYEMTGAHVSLSIVPTWAKGVEVNYRSPNFPVERLPGYTANNPAATTEQVVPAGRMAPAAAGTARDLVTDHESQVVLADNKQKCHICHITYNSAADFARKHSPLWVKCSPYGCTYWVHASCSGIYYDTEKALKSWSSKHFFCYRHLPED